MCIEYAKSPFESGRTLSFSWSCTKKWNLGRRLLGQINMGLFTPADLDEITSRRYEYFKVNAEFLPTETPSLRMPNPNCGRFMPEAQVCQNSWVSQCESMTEFLPVAVGWQLGLTLLSAIRDYVCETGYPGLDEVDLPWLEQRIRRLQQKAYEPSSASSSGMLRRIFSESQARTAAIIVLGESDLCSSILESHPFSTEAMKPKETDLY